MKQFNHRQRGFTIVSAIFILVVLAALGAFIVNVSTNQQIGSALDVQGVRAYQAARAGIEWGIYKVTRDGPSDNGQNYLDTLLIPSPASLPLTWCTSTDPAVRTTASFQLPATATTLTSFYVTVECYATRGANNDINGGPWVFTIRATACNQPQSGWGATTVACPKATPDGLYIERRLEVSF